MQLIEHRCRTCGIALAIAMTSESYEIEKVIVDASGFQLETLLDDILGEIAFVHPCQRLAVSALHPNGEVVKAKMMKLQQFFY